MSQYMDLSSYQQLLKELDKQEQKRDDIQNKYSFKIPDYILDELIEIEQDTKRCRKQLNIWIGLAITSGSLSRENGEKLRRHKLINNV